MVFFTLTNLSIVSLLILVRKYLRDNERNYLARKVINIPVHSNGFKMVLCIRFVSLGRIFIS